MGLFKWRVSGQNKRGSHVVNFDAVYTLLIGLLDLRTAKIEKNKHKQKLLKSREVCRNKLGYTLTKRFTRFKD